MALAKQGRKGEAVDVLRAAAEVKPGGDARSRQRHGQALVSLASILNQEGRKEEALKYLRQAAKYDKQIEANFIRPLEEEMERTEARAQVGATRVSPSMPKK